MKQIGVLTDSHSSITQSEAEKMGIRVLPAPFYIEGRCFYEDVTLSREELYKKLEEGADVNTSQPSPAEVMAFWDQALGEFENVLYMPISSGLSGSCATAMALAQEQPYVGRVFVVDNGRVGTPLYRSILDALEMIGEGCTAAEIKTALEDARDRMVIYLGVESLDNLRRGGRISAATASIGTVLHIKPVLKLGVGTLDTYKKCRGFVKARQTMIEALKHDLENGFQEELKNRELYLLAATSADEETTASWLKEIREAFPDMDVLCSPLSMGVCCHTGTGALGIGCSCRPRRPVRNTV